MGTNFTTRQLSTIIVFSALAAITSVPIGHISNYMKTIPFLPLGTGQILAGLHLIMLAFTALYVKRPGAATLTGTVHDSVTCLLTLPSIQVRISSVPLFPTTIRST